MNYLIIDESLAVKHLRGSKFNNELMFYQFMLQMPGSDLACKLHDKYVLNRHDGKFVYMEG
ncbi:hypothetical protein CVN76_18690 [Bacillus sp. mrc49]|nr:hypothetical protein CVN76_18690 [Bacillus sp. mrc49]